MHEKILAMLLLLFVVMYSLTSAVEASGLWTPLWSIPDPVEDLAISDDGSIVVESNHTHVKVFDGNGNLLWSWSPGSGEVTAVDVSAGGDEVVAAYTTGLSSYVVFWSNARNLSGTPDPLWVSVDLGGAIESDALAVSGDGQHVVAVGTGNNVFYWNNTNSLSGTMVNPTWSDLVNALLEYVCISYDGVKVAALGVNATGYTHLYFYTNSTQASTVNDVLFQLLSPNPVLSLGGLSMSANGSSLVMAYNMPGLGVIEFIDTSTLNSWAAALDGVAVADVVLSSGAEIAAAALNNITGPDSIIIYANPSSYLFESQPARARGGDSTLLQRANTGPTPTAVYTGASSFTSSNFTDIAVDQVGGIVVAGTGDYVLVVDSVNGSLMWSYGGTGEPLSDHVTVSSDGSIIASGGELVDSLYLFVFRPTIGASIEEIYTGSSPSLNIAFVGAAVLVIVAILTMKIKRSQNR